MTDGVVAPEAVVPQTKQESQPSATPLAPEANQALETQIQQALAGDLEKMDPKDARKKLTMLAVIAGEHGLDKRGKEIKHLKGRAANSIEAHRLSEMDAETKALLKGFEKPKEEVNKQLEEMMTSEDQEEQALAIEIVQMQHKSQLIEIKQNVQAYRNGFIENKRGEDPNITLEEIDQLLGQDAHYKNLQNEATKADEIDKNYTDKRSALKKPDGSEILPKIEPFALEMAGIINKMQEKGELTEKQKQEVKDNPMAPIQECLLRAIDNKENAKIIVNALAEKNLIKKGDKKALTRIFAGDLKNHLQEQILMVSALIGFLLIMFGIKGAGEMGGGGGGGGGR